MKAGTRGERIGKGMPLFDLRDEIARVWTGTGDAEVMVEVLRGIVPDDVAVDAGTRNEVA